MKSQATFRLAVFGIALSMPLMAQSTFGTIVGIVADPSGAAVPAASVEVINTDENVSRLLTTNGQGGFEAVNLKPGRYRIIAKKEGFGAVQVSDLVLDARQE